MEFGILGPLEVRHGPDLGGAGAKERARLAAGELARRDRRLAQPGGSVSGRRPANPVSGQCHHSTAGSPSTQHSR